MKLPTNRVILDDIKNIEDNRGHVNWETLLDSRPKAVYRLLYSLQIIDSLMQVTENNPVGASG